jgi:glycosyltransferase involved in cell wall biosynthesis
MALSEKPGVPDEKTGMPSEDTIVLDEKGGVLGEKNNVLVEKPKVLQLASLDCAVKTLLLKLMIQLRSEGFSVHAAAGDMKQGIAEEIEEMGFPFHRTSFQRNLSPLNLMKSLKNMVQIMRRERFDIVHVHTPIAGFLGRLAARLAGVPIIFYTAHGFYFHQRMPRLKYHLYSTLELLVGHLATDFMFSQSMEDADTAVRNRIIPAPDILYIGNGVDLNRFQPDLALGDQCRKELGIETDDVVITYMGRLVREKGILDLIEAFSAIAEKHQNCKLLIVGDNSTAGDRDTNTQLKLNEMTTNPLLEDKIIMTGFRNDPERILTGSDIFVLPSYREGLPRSICEAMACGVPVVATNIRGCREQVIDDQTGYLFPPGDVQSLVGYLDELIVHRGKRLSMGKASRKLAEEQFSEAAVVERQVGIYRRYCVLRESDVAEEKINAELVGIID